MALSMLATPAPTLHQLHSGCWGLWYKNTILPPAQTLFLYFISGITLCNGILIQCVKHGQNKGEKNKKPRYHSLRTVLVYL